MDKNQKRKVAGGAVYVFCAFMLVSILTVAMLTAIGNRRGANEPPEVSETPATDAATQPVPAGKSDSEREREWEETADTTRVPSGEKNIINGTEPIGQTANEPYVYNSPVNGTAGKKYSAELAVWSVTMGDYRAHMGVDIEAPAGEPVSAIADGTVSAVYCDEFMGNCVCIEHTGGMKSYYMNLTGEYPEGIAPGEAVACGQVIGAVGTSAKAEASDLPHLHLEVTVNGEHIDPTELIEVSAASYEDE